MPTYAAILKNVIDKSYNALKALPLANLNAKPNPERWSKKELIGHLVDSAYNNHQRFLRAESQGNLIFWTYAQDEWVIKNQYQNRNAQEIIELWYRTNQHLCSLVDGLSDEILHKQTNEHNFHRICMKRIEEHDFTSLGYLIWDYIFHLEHHLSQLLADYEKELGDFQGK
jgi:hypothetical protein